MSRCSESVLSNPWAGKGHLVTVQTLQEFGGEERRKTLLEPSHNMCYVRASRAFKTQNGSLLNCMHKDPETFRSALGVLSKSQLSVTYPLTHSSQEVCCSFPPEEGWRGPQKSVSHPGLLAFWSRAAPPACKSNEEHPLFLPS